MAASVSPVMVETIKSRQRQLENRQRQLQQIFLEMIALKKLKSPLEPMSGSYSTKIISRYFQEVNRLEKLHRFIAFQ